MRKRGRASLLTRHGACVRVVGMDANDIPTHPERIVVDAETFDAILEMLDRPAEPCPKLLELLRRPSVFDEEAD